MRMRHMMLVLLLILAAQPFLGRAADLSDEDYVNHYFGTSVIFITGKQLVDPAQNYWGNLLPQEFMYSQGTLVEIINKARREAGNPVLLKPADYPIAVGMETKREDGRWEYAIDFHNCTPAETQLVLDSVSITGALADCERETRPLCVGFFYAQAQSLSAVDLELGSTTVTLTPDLSLTEMIGKINEALAARFGDTCKADIFLSANDAIYGGKAISVNVTVYLDGAEAQFNFRGELAEPYEG